MSNYRQAPAYVEPLKSPAGMKNSNNPQLSRVNIPMAPQKEKRVFGKSIVTDGLRENIYVENGRQTEIVTKGLEKYYMEYVKNLEEAYRFPSFHSNCLNPVDFYASPQVLIIGNYSSGKSTFIQYLLERNYPGINIGVEMTTDKFIAIHHGEAERVIMGNAAAANKDYPFQQLQNYGMAFLNRFELVTTPSPILKHLTFIDTPGILSGEKQRIHRAYDFEKIVTHFANKVDRILVMYDVFKLDISDEFKSVLQCLQGNEDKIRILLNKADSVSSQELLKVSSALMFNMGRVMTTPEVPRVYVGSFWDQPLKPGTDHSLFLQEEAELLGDLRSLPRNSAIRRVNEVVKRTKQLRVHILIIEHLREQFGIFGKKKKQEKLLKNLVKEFKTIQVKYRISNGDFPHLTKFRDILANFQIWDFPSLSKKKLEKLDWVLGEGIPALLRLVQQPQDPTLGGTNITYGHSKPPSYESHGYEGDNPSHDDDFETNPFHDDGATSAPVPWYIPENERITYSNQFYQLKLVGNKLSGASARPLLMQSLSNKEDLKYIWDLSDIDVDGYLDVDEYMVCMFLINYKKKYPAWRIPRYHVIELVPPHHREALLQKMTREGKPVLSIDQDPSIMDIHGSQSKTPNYSPAPTPVSAPAPSPFSLSTTTTTTTSSSTPMNNSGPLPDTLFSRTNSSHSSYDSEPSVGVGGGNGGPPHPAAMAMSGHIAGPISDYPETPFTSPSNSVRSNTPPRPRRPPPPRN